MSKRSCFTDTKSCRILRTMVRFSSKHEPCSVKSDLQKLIRFCLFLKLHKICVPQYSFNRNISQTVKPLVRKRIKAALSFSWVIIVFCVTTL